MAVALSAGTVGVYSGLKKIGTLASNGELSGCFFGLGVRQCGGVRSSRRLSSSVAVKVPQASSSAAVEDGSPGETDMVPTPKVIIDQDSDPDATVVEITFGDRLGALLDTMNALKNLGLNVVKAKVFLDSSGKHNKFAITKADTGRKVDDPEMLESIRLTIINNLLEYHPESSAQLAMGMAFGVAPATPKEMGRVSESSALKRKRPDENSRAQNLTDAERMLLEVIKSKTDMGIWKGDMKKEISNKTLPDRVINKSLNDLKLKQLIKEVPNIHNKTKKLYMAIEFEPSSELTGGEWYTNGSLDGEFINMLKRECLLHIRRSNVSTIKEIVHAMNTRKVCTDDCSIQRITEIVRLLVLDNEVVEVKSTGIGNFMKIPVGTTCYKCTNKAAVSKVGAMASIPCGVCPRIQECTPDGIISPNTCAYYQKWLDF